MDSIQSRYLLNISKSAVPSPIYYPSERENKKGENHPRYGKKHTIEALIKISMASRGENNPRYGVKLSPETLIKMSEKKNQYYYDILDGQDRRKIRFENWKGAAEFLGLTRPSFFRYAQTGQFKTVSEDWWTSRFGKLESSVNLGYRIKRVSRIKL